MPNASYKLFGLLFSLIALAIASIVYFTVLSKGESEVKAVATAHARTIVEITNGFVNVYSDYQNRYAEGLLPVPATYRADAFRHQSVLSPGGSTSVVGLPGKEIANAAPDEQMRTQLIKLENTPDLEFLETELSQGETTIHRTLFPFVASVPGCANCHNQLQNLTGSDQWQTGDLMGAQFVDQNIQSELADVRHNAWLFAILVFLTTIAISYCCLFLFSQFQLGQELKRLATTDSMTGCINRREMYSRISQLSGRTSGALLMLDLDRFKQINDSFGHAAGDAVIQDFSRRIKSAIRSEDWVARIGGEEFVVWLPDIKPATALLIADRVRRDCESSPLQFDSEQIQYTVSIGLHVLDNDQPSRLDTWMQAADELLYKAKAEGRNRVVFQKQLMV